MRRLRHADSRGVSRELRTCPTLGCRSQVAESSEPSSFPWVRTLLGSTLLVVVATMLATTRHHCDNPGCMRAEVAASINATLLGLPGLWLAAPALRRLLRGHLLLVSYGIVAALTALCAAPGALILIDPLSTDKRLRLGWFSYSMTWDSLGDGICSASAET